MKNKKLPFQFLVAFFMLSFFVGHTQCITPTISGLSPTYCVNSPGSILTASPGGGIFQGAGMVGNTFSPSLAGPGTATVSYGTCTSSYAIVSSTVANSGLTYSIIPTSSSEAGVFLSDDVTSAVYPIGFSFLYFCTTYTSFVISSNGFISFNPLCGNGCCAGQSLPNSSTSIDNLIAGCWTDLNPGVGGTVSYATLGTAPNRTLFVNFVNVPFFGQTTTTTFQIRLMETSNNIEIHTSNIGSNSNVITQGIENAGGVIGIPRPGMNAASGVTASNTAVRFVPLINCVSTETTFVSPTSVSVVGSPSICSGGSTTLTASGNISYTWTGGAASNNSSIIANPSTNTSYSVSATNSFGCISSAAINVTVFAGIPTLAINSNTTSTCLGKTVTLTATGAITYSWNNNITNGISFTPSVTSNYIVTGANGCGTNTAAIVVSVVPYPVTAVAMPSLICAGNSATLTAVSAANLYTWMPSGATTSSVILGTNVSQVYTVTASDGTCVGMATVNLAADPVPTITTMPTTTTVCTGVPINLTASGGTSYTWTTVNLNGASITVTPNAPTNYQVVGQNSLGCTSSTFVSVITNPSPTLVIVPNTNLICEGDVVNLSVSGANTYTWDNGATTSTINVTPSVTTVYTVTGELNICSGSETISISVFTPTLSVSGNTSICVGETTTLTASAANTYSWSNGFTTGAIQVNPNTTSIYNVSALTTSSGINCPSSASIQVSVKPNPTLTAVASRSAMCKGESNTLTVSGANTYTWSNGVNTPSVAFSSSLVTTLNFSVIGTSSVGCTNTTSLLMKVGACTGIENAILNTGGFMSVFPNPNNGSFVIKSDSNLSISIVNELGQVVKTIELKSTNNYSESINHLASGIYFVIAEKDNQHYSQKIVVQN